MPFKFKKGEILKSQARKVVHNVFEFFANEAKEKALKLPLHQPSDRACLATGVSDFTLRKIKREVSCLGEEGVLRTPGKNRKKKSGGLAHLDDFDKCVIRQTIQEFYIRGKKVPSLRKLIPVLRERINFEFEKDSLRKVLYSLNFRWKRCTPQRKLLIERPNIVFWRNKFLREIREHRRMQRQLVYLDETWVDSNLTFQKCWQDENNNIGAISNVSSKNRLIVVHAGTSSGFIPGALLAYKASSQSGDYHGQMNFENFRKWLIEKLLPNLQPNSVVVMDNAPYHLLSVSKKKKKYLKINNQNEDI
ncbi:uncharacterized protein [Parasteatoda tepidariorum]|uniref:uncharacterized protein n=1 Tax=Parasteatoda tepidariorum TaxID=114398 RepID=UPI0039BD0C37